MKKVFLAMMLIIGMNYSLNAKEDYFRYQFKYFNDDEFTEANRVAQKENKIIVLFLLGNTAYDQDFIKYQLLNKKVGKILKEDFVVVIIKDDAVGQKYAKYFDGIVVVPSVLFAQNGEILYKAISGADMPLYKILLQVKQTLKK